jgi:hypothetical protein
VLFVVIYKKFIAVIVGDYFVGMMMLFCWDVSIILSILWIEQLVGT